MFDNQQLATQIQDTLNLGFVPIESGKKIAAVIHGEYDQHGEVKATMAVVVKVNNEWQVQTLVDWSHEDGAKLGFNVAWSR
jgi:hypothetical protein